MTKKEAQWHNYLFITMRNLSIISNEDYNKIFVKLILLYREARKRERNP